jgi:ABC-type transport system involved in multi-copper enzyme maturation permease subunit
MTLLRLYLWKEWREQRKLIAALAIALVLLTVFSSLLDDWSDLRSESHYFIITGITVLAFIPTVGSDLFARERRKPQLQFLDRVPAGLSSAYWGKLVFFLLTMAGSVLLGVLLSTLLVFQTGRELPSRLKEPDIEFWATAATIGVFSTWVFATSTWVRSSVLAVPIVLLAVAGLVFVAVLPIEYLNLDYMPTMIVDFGTVGYMALVALISARLSFVNAARRRKPARTAMWTCFGMALVAWLPIHAPIASSVIRALNQPFIIRGAVIGENSRFAFFDLGQRGVLRIDSSRGIRGKFDPDGQHWIEPSEFTTRSVVRLDLESGELEFLGAKQSTVLDRARGRRTLAGIDQQLAAVINLAAIRPRISPGTRMSENSMTLLRDIGTTYYDLRTGRLTELTRSQVHAALKLGPADFGLEEFPAAPELYRSGFGSCASLLADSMEHPTYFRTADGEHTMATQRVGIGQVRVLPDGFLVRSNDQWLFDKTEYGYPVRLPAIFEEDTILALLSDGSIFVRDKSDALHITDPSRVERRQLRIGQQGGPLHSRNVFFVECENPDRTPIDINSRFIVALEDPWSNSELGLGGWNGGANTRLATIDFRTGEVTPTGLKPGYDPVMIQSNDTEVTLIEWHKRLVRYNVDTLHRTVLFDSSDL